MFPGKNRIRFQTGEPANMCSEEGLKNVLEFYSLQAMRCVWSNNKKLFFI